MILSNLGQPRFKWCIPQCAISHRGMGGLEHDPEKLALGLDPRVGTGFPSRQTRSVCPEIMLKQKDEIRIRFNQIGSRSCRRSMAVRMVAFLKTGSRQVMRRRDQTARDESKH